MNLRSGDARTAQCAKSDLGICKAWRSICGNEFRTIGLLVVLSLCLSPLSAQVKSSAITGIVTDRSGAMIANASVTVTDADTGAVTSATTTDKGDYTVPYLPAGRYTLLVKMSGFETYQKNDITMGSSTTVREDVMLAPGSVNSTVVVQAEAAALQTENPTVQGAVDQHLIAYLPNINNNPLYYATLQAGVVPDPNVYNSQALGVGFTDRQSMSQLRVNGGELGTNDILLDGLSVQGAAWHETAVVPNPDALEEVRVMTNTFTADVGNAQGLVSMTTRSGTNTFHGDLNYRIRNEMLNANGLYNNAHGIPRAKYRLDEGGGSVGGPVIIPKLFNGKDRLFFFVSFLRLTHASPDTFLGKVPSLLERQGDFSQTNIPDVNGNPVPVHIYNPFTATPYQGSNTIFQRQIYPGAVVTNPSPYGLKLLQGYPAPNHTPSDAFDDNNYSFSGTTPEVRNSFNGRLDYRFGRHSIYATGGVSTGSNTPPNQWGNSPFVNMNWPGLTTDDNPYGAIGDTITLNPTTVVDLRYGVTHIHTQSRIPAGTGFNYSDYGMPTAVQALAALPGTAPSIGNFTSTDNASHANYSNLNNDEWDRKLEAQLNHSVTGSITKVLGKWTLKGGAEYRVYLGNWTDLQLATPSLGIFGGASSVGEFSQINGANSSQITNPQDAGIDVAAVATGALGWTMPSGTSPKVALAAKYVAFYTQNSWKVTPRLTLNLGLRYEVQPGPTERYNRMSSVDLRAANPFASGVNNGNSEGGLGLLTFPGVGGYSRNLYQTNWNNISPRVGAAYQFDSVTVVRGGYGRIYIPSNTGFNANGLVYGTGPYSPGANANPFGLSPNGLPVGTFDQVQNTILIPAAGAHQVPAVYGANSAGVDVFNRFDYKTGYTDQWNVAIERKLGSQWTASVAYIGSHGTNLPWRGFPLNGVWNLPDSTLESWRNTWVASNGVTDPSQVQVANPMPSLIGQASGGSGQATISAMQAQESYLALLGQTNLVSRGTMNYNALQIEAEHPLSHGLLLMLNYVWSKSLGVTGGPWSESYAESQAGGTSAEGSGAGVDYRNLNNNYSLLAQDIPNRFVAAISYLLPTGKGAALDPGNRVARAIVGDWELASAVTLQSGVPFGPNCGGPINGRCNVVPGESLTVPKSLQHWYDGSTSVNLPDGRTITPAAFTYLRWNPDAFSQPVVQLPNGTYQIDQYTSGTTAMSMGTLRSPGFSNTNLSITRRFNLGEKLRMEFHADATNAWNQTNILANSVNNSVSSVLTVDSSNNAKIGQNGNGGYGAMAMNLLEPRQITLALRLQF
jgi:trimeric autotransporter adhesin